MAAEVALHPLASDTVTVKLPELVTVIDGVVAPLDQALPVALLEVRVTEPPWQKVNGPFALMVGVGGF